MCELIGLLNYLYDAKIMKNPIISKQKGKKVKRK